jgi:hypothetical protein
MRVPQKWARIIFRPLERDGLAEVDAGGWRLTVEADRLELAGRSCGEGS